MADSQAQGYSRRAALTYGVGAAIVIGGVSFSRFAQAQGGGDGLHRLAELLVARPLDPALTARAATALAQVDAGFPAKLQALKGFIAANRIADVEALKAAPGFAGSLHDTAKTIIACLYEGFAGTPRAFHSTDNVQFVTYTQALMYQVNRQYVPIPSYSTWGPGYWAQVPIAPALKPRSVPQI
ncbi:MAG TPA: sugar dehydrogenase complex small subunit [Caulobacteraceae bacterium]|nr:sugar dehydrogenase complex small subunit [Caulobacteraceae bacterium]